MYVSWRLISGDVKQWPILKGLMVRQQVLYNPLSTVDEITIQIKLNQLMILCVVWLSFTRSKSLIKRHW